MRDWNTPPPSGAFPAPAEGLPPCVVMAARLDNRIAWWATVGRCKCVGVSQDAPAHHVLHGQLGPPPQGQRGKWLCRDWFIVGKRPLLTDDPDEAQAAFDKGAEYVRTGEMP